MIICVCIIGRGSVSVPNRSGDGYARSSSMVVGLAAAIVGRIHTRSKSVHDLERTNGDSRHSD